jgi:hypothetical protein
MVVITYLLQGATLSDYVVFTCEKIYEGMAPTQKQNYEGECECFYIKSKNRNGIVAVASDLGFEDSKSWKPYFSYVLRGCGLESSASTVMKSCSKVLNHYFKPSGPYVVEMSLHGDGVSNHSFSYHRNVCTNSNKTLKRFGKIIKKLLEESDVDTI